MRNSKILILVGFLLGSLVLNSTLSYLLIPNNVMRIKMHNLETSSYEDLFLGTSHGLSAVDPAVVDEITGRQSSNLCVWSEYPRDSYYLLKNAMLFQKPTRVIYELDPTYWLNKDQDTYHSTKLYHYMSWSLVKVEYFFAKILSTDFRIALFPWFNYQLQWQASLENLTLKQTDNYRNFGLENFDLPYEVLKENGFLYLKDTKANKSKNMTLWDEAKLQPDALRYFQNIVTYCRENHIELVVFTAPVSKETLELYPESFQAANRYFTDLMNHYGLRYYNFNYIELEGFDNSLAGFTDYDGHMLGETAMIFSKYLGEYLK